MNLNEIKEKIENIYTLRYASLQIWRDSSLFCHFQSRSNDIFVVSLNAQDQKIYCYLKDKESIIDNIKSIIPFLVLQNKENVYFFNIKSLNEPQLLKLFSSILSSVESYMDANLYFSDTIKKIHSKTKQPLVKSFMDTAGNCLIAPRNSSNCFIRFAGSNNIVEIDPEANIHDLYIEVVGSDSTVRIGKEVSWHGTIRVGFGCEVRIGDRTTSTNSVYATCAEQTRLIIGSDCMFATNNQLCTDDAYAIYDVHAGKRTNKSKDIQIGDHVWIGYGATISSGTVIGSGSVVGAYSFVRSQFPNNCVIAGVPAKLVRKDIFWERSLLLNAQEEIIFSDAELSVKSYCRPTDIGSGG